MKKEKKTLLISDPSDNTKTVIVTQTHDTVICKSVDDIRKLRDSLSSRSKK